MWRTDHQKGTIRAVNRRKRALLTRRTDNITEAQSTLCVDNKKDKTELKAVYDNNISLNIFHVRVLI